jgi:hypothetical protein
MDPSIPPVTVPKALFFFLRDWLTGQTLAYMQQLPGKFEFGAKTPWCDET